MRRGWNNPGSELYLHCGAIADAPPYSVWYRTHGLAHRIPANQGPDTEQLCWFSYHAGKKHNPFLTLLVIFTGMNLAKLVWSFKTHHVWIQGSSDCVLYQYLTFSPKFAPKYEALSRLQREDSFRCLPRSSGQGCFLSRGLIRIILTMCFHQVLHFLSPCAQVFRLWFCSGGVFSFFTLLSIQCFLSSH